MVQCTSLRKFGNESAKKHYFEESEYEIPVYLPPGMDALMSGSNSFIDAKAGSSAQ
jgi:hypothetical protein